MCVFIIYACIVSKQVLSESVAAALPLVVEEEASETARFVLTFDKFYQESPPYRGPDDVRLKV